MEEPMKVVSSVFMPLILLSGLLGAASPALADAGVFFGNGQDLHQITSKTIRLVSIDVTIVLGEGTPVSAESATLDKKQVELERENLAEYRCRFVLQSLSDKPEEVQVGFPVESGVEPENEPGSSAAELSEWVKEYAFAARDEKNTYPVEFVHRKPKNGPGEFGSVFTWKINFQPNETKTLIVTYQINMSMSVASTSKDENTQKMTQASEDWFRTRSASGGAFQPEVLDLALARDAGYITSTGSSWSGNVETATFTLITDSFERNLERNGIPENAAQPDKETQRPAPFPLQQPWWFRQVAPEGWKPVKGGVQWSYRDYKPKDAIEVRYFLTQLPNTPDDVDKFATWFTKKLKPGVSVADELTRVKDVLLAIYGKEPADSLTRRFVEDQLWYAPLKTFSMANLSETQKAMLEKLDVRITLAKRIQ
jgi:hypothetical protein